MHRYIQGDMMGIKRPFTIALNDETRTELEQLAKKEHVTVSAYACMVLDMHVDSKTDGE